MSFAESIRVIVTIDDEASQIHKLTWRNENLQKPGCFHEGIKFMPQVRAEIKRLDFKEVVCRSFTS